MPINPAGRSQAGADKIIKNGIQTIQDNTLITQSFIPLNIPLKNFFI